MDACKGGNLGRPLEVDLDSDILRPLRMLISSVVSLSPLFVSSCIFKYHSGCLLWGKSRSTSGGRPRFCHTQAPARADFCANIIFVGTLIIGNVQKLPWMLARGGNLGRPLEVDLDSDILKPLRRLISSVISLQSLSVSLYTFKYHSGCLQGGKSRSTSGGRPRF